MVIPRDSLDNLTWANLVDGATRLIPELDPWWTDFNPSDPGMTLVELFAWVTEMLLYQLDRTPDRVLQAFLRLIAGPDWVPTNRWESAEDRTRDLADVLGQLEKPERAVTAVDFEQRALDVIWLSDRALQALAPHVPESVRVKLARLKDRPLSRATWRAEIATVLGPADSSRFRDLIADQADQDQRVGVGRAHCIPLFNLTTHADELSAHEGHLTVVVLPKDRQLTEALAQPPQAADQREQNEKELNDLRERVKEELEPRRPLGTRLHVGLPVFVPLKLSVSVTRTREAEKDYLKQDLERHLQNFLDPHVGGPDGTGWPFERPIYLSELLRHVRTRSGVEEVTHLFLNTVPEDGVRGATWLWHDKNGGWVGLSLLRHQLPWLLPIPVSEVVILPPLVEWVSVRIPLSGAGFTVEEMGKRRLLIERALAPFRGGDESWPTTRSLKGLLEKALGKAQVDALALQAVDAELRPNQLANPTVVFQ